MEKTIRLGIILGTTPKMEDLVREYGIVLIKKWEGMEKSAIYILTSRELDMEERERLKNAMASIYDPKKYAVLFLDDLAPAQLKQVLERYETVYVGDKELCESILAGILVMGHDFRFFVDEKMNLLIRKRLSELIPNL